MNPTDLTPYPTGEWIVLGPWFELKRIPGPFVLANKEGVLAPMVWKRDYSNRTFGQAHSIYFLPPAPVVESDDLYTID